MKVLLVDDDKALLTVFQTAFKNDGFEVVTASTGEDGLTQAKTEKPDAIVLDQVLTDIPGNEVLQRLKQDEETKDIPVMILSNFSQQELVDKAIEQGATDYLFKYQVEPKDVVEKVKTIVNKN